MEREPSHSIGLAAEANLRGEREGGTTSGQVNELW